MKNKKILVAVVIFVLIIIATVMGISIYNKIVEEGRKYQVVEINDPKFYKISENDKIGVIDTEGNVIIEPKYEDVKIPNPEKAIFVCYDGAYVVVLNDKNVELYTEYTNIEPIDLENIGSEFMYEKSVLKYEENGKFGLIDLDGKRLTDPIYESIEGLSYKEGELLVKQGEFVGVINIKGNELVKVEYEEIIVDGFYTEDKGYTTSGYIVSVKTSEGYRYGYIDNTGEVVIEPKYNELSRINDITDEENIYLIAAENGKFGVLKNKTNLISNDYQSIVYNEQNNIFIIQKNKEYGVINIDGEQIIATEYIELEVQGIHIVATNINRETTVFSGTGEIKDIDVGTTILNTKNENYYIKTQVVNEMNTKFSVVDRDFNELVPLEYNYIEYINNNYFIATGDNRKLGIIDSENNIVIEIKYDSIQRIQDTDLIQMYIKETGNTQIYTSDLQLVNEMIDMQIKQEEDFFILFNELETKYIDKEGNVKTSKELYPNNELYAVNIDGKWGYEDKDGNIVIQPIYEKANEFNKNGYAAVKENGKWKAININGEITTELEYEFPKEEYPNFINKYYQYTYGHGEVCFKK